MKKFIVLAVLLSQFSAQAASLADKAINFVPGGTVVQEKLKEVKIQSPKGSIVEVEFHSNGTFEEASGNNPELDGFVPQNGLMSLVDAVKAVKEQGKAPRGEWSLERSFLKGWYYEFVGYENGQKLEYLVDAKDGKIFESHIDF